MLFNSWSWPQFSAVVLIGVSLWYLVVWWRYFRKKSVGVGGPLGHRWDAGVEELEDRSELMGKALDEAGTQVVQAGDFGFGEAKVIPMPLERSEQLGLVADVQKEISEVCRVLAENDGHKEDFFELMEVVRAKYPAVKSSPLLSQLNQLVRERVPFHLSDRELEDLWG